ncbi:MAG: monovalent cation/H+ antiporter subunit D family protein [Chloroflexi bacterium]|nr:monovalent cation/H+ antiporter subunit D family protein [Chloroflexota bacterium]MBM3174823.1 monovalent cation/H+ antiporter subunit D family protein [Chloroflexota bacterium]MBM4450172.1 monovalent cation/H+ antiporter subunit D family protein [Chloroflexota bacterium]
MEAHSSLKPLVAVLVPLLASLLIMLSGKRPNIRELWTVLGSVAMFGIVFSMLPSALGSKYPEIVLFTISPGIALAFRADTAGIIFGLSASALWIVTSIFSIGYMRSLSEEKQTRYYTCFAICLSSAMGIAFAANLLTFVIFYEMLTIATYPLVIHKESPEAIQAGRKYLAYLLTGGLVLIIATALTYKYTGTLDFSPGGFLSGVVEQHNLLPLFVLFLVGLGMKAALIPFHSWLPTAMIAPTPVSALLHAVAVVKAGVFGFVRVIGFVFGPTLFHEIGAGNMLAVMASITIIASSLLAMYQNNLKRRLAYSTVVHLGYILLGVALLSPSAWVGGLVHIANHAAMKITLFFCAGAIYVKTHCENISELDGIGRQMPITMGAFALVSIGLVGMPPLNGFISKWFLGQGTLAAGEGIYLIVLLLSGLLNAGYLFPIVRRAFFAQSSKRTKFAEASILMLAPLVLTALISLFLGLVPDGIFHFYSLAGNVATSVLAGAGR